MMALSGSYPSENRTVEAYTACTRDKITVMGGTFLSRHSLNLFLFFFFLVSDDLVFDDIGSQFL